MQYTIPHYFEDFRCVAAECTDTCCAGWAIMIDEKSLERYERLEGSFGNRLRNSIDWQEGSFGQYEGRCAFLNEKNLCDLHIEAGEDMLCDTCKNYPRHLEEYEGVREATLSLSCIEAAKMILGCAEPVEFITFKDEEEDEEYEDFDFLLFTKLMDARETVIKVLQNREIDIMVRMAVVLKLSAQMQEAVKRNELYKIDELLEKFGEHDEIIELQREVEKQKIGENEYGQRMRKMFRTFSKLEVLKQDWPEYVKKAEKLLWGEGQTAYEKNRVQFEKAIGAESGNYDVWSAWIEQLMVYFVFTYFSGAVYDGNVLGKMQTAVVSTLLIKELAQASWIDKKEKFSFDDFVDIAHRFSREIEHSDVNLLRMEKMFGQNAIFQPQQLQNVILY